MARFMSTVVATAKRNMHGDLSLVFLQMPAGWRMTGHETVSLVLRTPGGLPVAQALTFHRDGGFFTAAITAVDVRSAAHDRTILLFNLTLHLESCQTPLGKQPELRLVSH